MSDVAREAGVSTMTVTRATRATVLRVAERMGHVFDLAASTLRSQRTGFVAALIPSLNSANFADTLRGLIEQLLRRRPEAIMLTGGTHTARARRLLATAGIPAVETWDLPARPPARWWSFPTPPARARWSPIWWGGGCDAWPS